jgi:hypothetical protein
VSTSTITHWNNRIDRNFSYLESATLLSTLELTRLEPPDDPNSNPQPVDAETLTIPFKFFETPNDCNNTTGVCTDASDDYFALAIDAFPSGDILFEYEGHDYLLSVLVFDPFDLGADPLIALGGDRCGAVGLESNCVGFVTEESSVTTRQFAFEINAVPLPAAAWLFASALGVVGYMGKRRMSGRQSGAAA